MPISSRSRDRVRVAILAVLIGALAFPLVRLIHYVNRSNIIQDGGGMVGVENSVFLYRPPLNTTFDFSHALFPEGHVFESGNGKDGLQSLTMPPRVPVAEMRGLRPNSRVIGVAIGNEEIAFPIAILNWHFAINDVVGGVPVAVLFSPLSDVIAVVDRRVGEEIVEFGVAGLLYNSSDLFFDRRPSDDQESLWCPLMFEAVAGPLVGTQLRTLPHTVQTWELWRNEHQAGSVLSFQTGYSFNYDLNPFDLYLSDERSIPSPIVSLDTRLGRKEEILGFLTSAGPSAISLADVPLGHWDVRVGEERVGISVNTAGIEIESIPFGIHVAHAFWYSWGAVYPDTEILTFQGGDVIH